MQDWSKFDDDALRRIIWKGVRDEMHLELKHYKEALQKILKPEIDTTLKCKEQAFRALNHFKIN